MIKQIRIRNFRSLVDVTVDLDPSLTVLIGRSGTGKSNFVEAIRFLRDCLRIRDFKFDNRDGIMRAHHRDHSSQLVGFDIQFAIPGLETDLFYALRRPPTRVTEELLRIGDKTLFHHANGAWIVPPVPNPEENPGTIMLGGIPALQASTFAYKFLCSDIGFYDFPSEVLTGPKSGGLLDGLVERGINYLTVAESIFSEPTRSGDWKRISRAVHAINRSIGELELSLPGADHMFIRHQTNGRSRLSDVRQESEGFRRYLAHLLALYQNPSKQTLIFEHPETGLHPGALESLAEEFKDCPDEGRGQVILTTHSPQLLDYFPASSIRVVDIENQETRIGPLSSEQLDSLKQHLLFPGELLTVDPARLPGQLDEVAG